MTPYIAVCSGPITEIRRRHADNTLASHIKYIIFIRRRRLNCYFALKDSTERICVALRRFKKKYFMDTPSLTLFCN